MDNKKESKEYYGYLLNQNRSNMKATWGIINSVINNYFYFVKDKLDIYNIKW